MSFKTEFVSDASTVKTMPGPAERQGQPGKYDDLLAQVTQLSVNQGIKVFPEEGSTAKDLRNRVNVLRKKAADWLNGLDAHLSIRLVPDEDAVFISVAPGRSQPRPRAPKAPESTPESTEA